MNNLFYLFLIFFNVYVFLRERERERGSGGEAEREGDTDSEAGSRLRAVGTELDTRLEPTNLEIMTGAKVGCLTDCATRVPLKNFFFKAPSEGRLGGSVG